MKNLYRPRGKRLHAAAPAFGGRWFTLTRCSLAVRHDRVTFDRELVNCPDCVRAIRMEAAAEAYVRGKQADSAR